MVFPNNFANAIQNMKLENIVKTPDMPEKHKNNISDIEVKF